MKRFVFSAHRNVWLKRFSWIQLAQEAKLQTICRRSFPLNQLLLLLLLFDLLYRRPLLISLGTLSLFDLPAGADPSQAELSLQLDSNLR